MTGCNEALARVQAVQDIEYLRRWYAKATDKIGEATEASVREGREIYHRIFAEKATLAAGVEDNHEQRVGPDAWADLVLEALGELGPTQHLIGTQIVSIDSLELDDDCHPARGSARMESYLQAWHERRDEKVWLFLGTYFDEVKFTPGVGWQIYGMKLERVAGELRYMGAAVATNQ